MEYRIEFREEAQRDIFQAYQWYEKRQEGLGNKFILEIESDLNYLRQTPKAFPEKRKRFREFILKTFPYIIIFRVDNKTVTIFAIFHTSLNPAKKP